MADANAIIVEVKARYGQEYVATLDDVVRTLDGALDAREQKEADEGLASIADAIAAFADRKREADGWIEPMLVARLGTLLAKDPTTVNFTEDEARRLGQSVLQNCRGDALLDAAILARNIVALLPTHEWASAAEGARILEASLEPGRRKAAEQARELLFKTGQSLTATGKEVPPVKMDEEGTPLQTSPSEILEGLLHAAAYFDEGEFAKQGASPSSSSTPGEISLNQSAPLWLVRRTITMKDLALCEQGHQTRVVELGLQSSGLGPRTSDYPVSAVLCGQCGDNILATVKSDFMNRFPPEIEANLLKITSEYEGEPTAGRPTTLTTTPMSHSTSVQDAQMLAREYASLCPPYGAPLAYGYAHVVRFPGEGLRLVFQSDERDSSGSPLINALLTWQSPATAKFGGRLDMQDGFYLIFGGRKTIAKRVARILNDG